MSKKLEDRRNQAYISCFISDARVHFSAKPQNGRRSSGQRIKSLQ
ncbi:MULTISPECIES: hypothetical protein [Planktothricoides]|uniref:Uncharacterized protein n=1 Tax=Planktothricoides raciborskii GIHE-MW2 TaxID=2792601 RepID=A0AAU8JDQ5_9CYAN|nr:MULTISPECIES: hypothetical protein [Planktothricoides]